MRPPSQAAASAQPHRHRFRAIYAVLGLALAAAVARRRRLRGPCDQPGADVVGVEADRRRSRRGEADRGALSPNYRLPDGNQLVDVIAERPGGVVGRPDDPDPTPRGARPEGEDPARPREAAPNENTLTFSLCGLGTSCSIATGKPSVARGTLVRREILELALYTFKYVGGVKQVVAFMPPPAGTPAAVRRLLAEERRRAAAEACRCCETLAPEGAAAGEDHRRARSSASTRSREPRIYKFGISQTQQGDAVLVLTPLQLTRRRNRPRRPSVVLRNRPAEGDPRRRNHAAPRCLAILAIVAFSAGFVIHWLFIVAAVSR